jgi:hypothetical protein
MLCPVIEDNSSMPIADLFDIMILNNKRGEKIQLRRQ